MNRREFLIGSGLAAGCAGRGWAQTADKEKDKAKLDRIAIMTLAFNTLLKSPAHPDDPKRTLEILDLPQMLVERYGTHHVELQHAHFASTESAYLKEFRERLKKARSQMNQINLEFGILNISSADPVLLVETIDLTKQWIDHAAEVGCPRVMVNQGTLAPEVKQTAIATLKAIGDYGKAKKVFVTMENRGGGGGRAGTPVAAASTAATATPAPAGRGPGTAGWQVVVEVIKAAGIYANPDVGNFPDEEQRHAGLRVMYPMSSGSSHCHYNPERYSEADAIKISKEMGYKGLYSIEASANNGPDPYSAIQNILDELVKDIS
jgi:hypothetical protein